MNAEVFTPELREEKNKDIEAHLGAVALDNYYLQDIEEIGAKDGAEVDLTVTERSDDAPDYFVDWQAECLEKIKHEKNVIISAPTGSGKTAVLMEWAKFAQEESREEGKKSVIYITAPIKALSNQRFRELEEQGYKVGLETGDVKNIPEDAEIICCTQEIFTNKYCNDENAILVVDELHYMFENEDRQRAYIDGLHKTRARNVLACSATMGDLSKTTGYIDKVTGREFFGYETEERLTELSFEGEIEPSKVKNALVVSFSINNILGINDTLCSEREAAKEKQLDGLSEEEKALAERKEKEKKEEIEKLAKKYGVELQGGEKYGVANYYGKMLPKEKLFVEELFEKGLIDTVVGTDALAMGVNFPIENVVFTQLMKYQGGDADSERLSKNLFDQLCGRAGRKGYYDHGHVYYSTGFKNKNGYPTEGSYKKYDYDGYEWVPYKTGEIFDSLIAAENEDISITLHGNMRGLLLGEASIEDEARYIVGFSTEYDDSDFEKVKQSLEERLKRIRGYRVDYDYPEYDEEFIDGIGDVYDETLSSEEREADWKNCELFARIILDYHDGEYEGKKISTRDLYQIYAGHMDNFGDLLRFRRYVHSLPSKYRRMYDLAGLDNAINAIDSTALGWGSGMLKSESISADKLGIPDAEILMAIYDFENISDEIFEMIENGIIPAETVFSRLEYRKQFEYAELFKSKYGCDIDMTSIIEGMYDETDGRKGNREKDIDYLVRDNLIKIFKLGGNLKSLARDYYGFASNLDFLQWDEDEDLEPDAINDIIEASRGDDFWDNIEYIIDNPDVKADIVSDWLDNNWHWPFEKVVCNEKAWNYLVNDLKMDRSDILEKLDEDLDENVDIEKVVSSLLGRGFTKEDVLSFLKERDRLRRNGIIPMMPMLTKYGFSAEKLYEEYVRISNQDDDSALSILLGCGVPAQKIVDSISDVDTLLEHIEFLEKNDENISVSQEKYMELVKKELEYLVSPNLIRRIFEYGIKIKIDPSSIADLMKGTMLVANMDLLKEYGINVDVNSEIGKMSPWSADSIGVDFLLDHGASPEVLKGLADDDDKRYELKSLTKNNFGSAFIVDSTVSGKRWKEMIDEAVKAREGENEN